jgi:FlaA1/EpsC-like NDP-sugar epimerase
MRRWYFLYDLLALGVSGVVAMAIETNLGVRGDYKELGIRFVTAFMACEMLVLHLLRVYRRVWSRSSMREFVLIAMGLMIGGAMASCIFQATSGELAWSGVRVSLIAVGAATWLLLVPRAVPEIAREFAIDSTHRFLTKRKNSGLQILVYGAGDMGNLFVQHLKTCSPRQFQAFQVSGFLDDNPNLRNRTINGFKIHGDLGMLDQIVETYPVHGILIAIADLSQDRLVEILAIAEGHGLAVYQWTVDLEARRLAAGQTVSSGSIELWRGSDGRPEVISAKGGLI